MLDQDEFPNPACEVLRESTEPRPDLDHGIVSPRLQEVDDRPCDARVGQEVLAEFPAGGHP